MDVCNVPGLMDIDDAIKTMLTKISPISLLQTRLISDAIGFVIAEDIVSPISVPPFANSAMDGFAVHSHDLNESSQLPIIGQSLAGHPFNQVVPKGSCIKIMTGAKVPEGCNAVIVREAVNVKDDIAFFTHNENSDATQPAMRVKPMQHIRSVGDDINHGDIVLSKGHRLNLRDISMLATLGLKEVTVFNKPTIAIFSTGDELKPLGSVLAEGEIYDSNRYGLIPLFESMGCNVIDLGIIPDDSHAIEKAFIKADQLADIVVTSGGVSVGDADFVKDIVSRIGKINFWKLAIKPGKPFAFGELNNSFFCGLPGNPVSSFVTAYALVQPIIAKLSGHSEWQPPVRLSASSQSNFRKQAGRTDYQRGIFSIKEGLPVVETTGNQSSGAFRSMSLANCFIILERERGNVSAGENVTIELFNPQIG
ncbi:molybdopterin molybdotransferase MoeA [Vibrio sp.]|nr:molybdopterin molybdotransferase MoeA [Vibrio sp.]